MSSSFRPGMIGATITPTLTPARASRSMVRMRRAGVVTKGSMARAFASFQKGTLTITESRATRDSSWSTSMSRSMRGAFVMMPTGLRYSAQTSRQPRVRR